MGSKSTPAVQKTVYAAQPRSITRNKDTVETSTKAKRRASYGIDDTFMRAFAEAAGNGAQTLGS